MNLHEEKKRLRTVLKQRRAEMSDNERLEKAELVRQNLMNIDVFHQAKSVFCYLAYLTEVETKAILNILLERQCQVAVPRIIDQELMVAAPFTDWSELEADRYGILTPLTNTIETGPFDVAITPGLGFTLHGARLGYGRGYYDRWFSRHETGTRIGLAFESQLLEALPVEETDIALDILVTEKQTVDLRN